MRSILYFILLFGVFGSPSLFAIGQLEEKKIEAVDSIREGIDIEQNLKQDSLKNTTQQGNEFSESGVDKPNVEKIQDAGEATNKKESQYNKNEIPTVEEAVSRESDKDFGNNLLDESKSRMTPSLPSVTDKMMSKNLILPPSTSVNKNATDLQKDLQVDKKVSVEKNKPSESLEEKKVEGQVGKEEVKELAENYSGENQKKPITRKDKENAQEKNLQKWTELNRESIEEWYHKSVQDESVYKRQYDNLNEHLPTTVFVDDYSKQLFYCIKKDNLICLRAIISKLEKLGLTVQEVLKFRNKLGDTPLIYAVKRGEIDIVRFLLLQGADTKLVNQRLQSPIDIAIERGRVDMINAIAEMMPYLLEHKRIDSKEDLEMYNWAVKTKEDNKLLCNKKDD